jgi:sugar phosphate isomerase/epimerase
MDGKPPGPGNYPFGALVRVLKEVGYKGWLSVEPFTFEPDGETVAREAARYLRGL